MKEKKGSNMRILLADDDYNFGYVLKKELEERNFIVDVVNNGVDAVLNFIKGDYGFLLLDIIMPCLNGLDALKIIKTLKGSKAINPQAQIITFSVESDKYRDESIELGAVRCIGKPFSIEALSQFILSLSELPS